MEDQHSISLFQRQHFFKKVRFEVIQRNSKHSDSISAADTDPLDPLVEDAFTDDQYIEDDYESQAEPSRKRSKKRKIYCFNCNRQEFHIMAYKGTMIHSFLVGMTFGLARIFGPYRCTCCGKKRAMFADYCSLSYHWRMYSERRLSKSGRRRRSGRRR